MTHYGHISESGKLTIDNPKRFAAEVAGMKPGPVEITIKRKNRRSLPQNRYYHAVVVEEIRIRLKQLGNDFDYDTVHGWLKGKFNLVEVVGNGGEVIGKAPDSTTKLNKTEFMEYLDKIIQWAAEFLQISIPEPGVQTEMIF